MASPKSGKGNEILSEKIYRQIKEDILRCVMTPGEQIVEAAIARELGVSRTPVREALTRLIQEGYVKVSRASGYAVSPATLRDLREVYKLRERLEGYAVKLATQNIAVATLDQLEDLLGGLPEPARAIQNGGHRLRFVEINTEFHMTLAQASGNRRLEQFISRLLEEASRYVYLNARVVRSEDIDESKHILTAMRDRDAGKAQEAMRFHIESAYKRIIEIVVEGDAELISLEPDRPPDL